MRSLGGARLQDQVLALLRDQVAGIIVGAVLLFIGLAACVFAAIRGRGGVRILVWFGIFCGMYGARLLAQTPAAFRLLPQPWWPSRNYVIAIITYTLIIPALLFWWELSLGALRPILRIMILIASVVGIIGVFTAFLTDSPYRFQPYNKLLAICFLLVLAAVNAVPSLAKRFLLLPGRVPAIGTLVLAVAALYTNLAEFLRLPLLASLEPIAFIIFVFSIGYVAAEKVFADERRLISISNELAIAREIQNSILPSSVPNLDRLSIASVYRPMTEVAGDFYEFVVVDQHRVGFLVADVSGHGVPAALIASMIKVAMHSVAEFAHDPRQVLVGLNRILSGQLRGQFVTAAYLWLDTERNMASYSAAGHPPLLRWRDGKLDKFESNGLLFGVMPDCDYPVCEMPVNPGDRFLLYTDGVTEPENAKGEAFGDNRLEQVVRNSKSQSASELSDQLFSAIGQWQPESMTQQDDMTLITIDVG